MLKTIVGTSMMVACLCLMSCSNSAQNSEPDATVTTPPDAGSPFVIAHSYSLDPYGYEANEFFYQGQARAYVNDGTLDSDGRWKVKQAAVSPYKTRMIIYRPTDPAAFNGTVLVEWLNITGGVDTAAEWISMHTEMMRQGYVWVGISAQIAGVNGDPNSLTEISLPLVKVNPDRYGSLSIPSDSFSYDIYRQGARAIRYPAGLAPLADLKIRHMIAMGESQSAARLLTFVDALGPQTTVFDGYFIHSRLGSVQDLGGGASALLSQSPQDEVSPPTVVQIRSDLGKPVLDLQTETDQVQLGAYTSRQDDSDTFRLWEVAGTAHADTYISSAGITDKGNDVATAELTISYKPSPISPACNEPINSAPQHHFVAEAALRALNAWVSDGTLPPEAPRLTINADGTDYDRDANGNALGGIRTPYVDAPTAVLSGINGVPFNSNGDLCFLYGQTLPFDTSTLSRLYPTLDDYVADVTASTNAAVAAGFLLQEDAPLIIDAAQASSVP